MAGSLFLISIAILGVGLTGFAGLLGLVRRPGADTDLTAGDLRVVHLFSVAAVLFALMPFPLYYAFGAESVVWRAGSGLLGLFLVFMIGFNLRKMRIAQPRWPKVMTGLLALSALVLLAEGLNTVWWGSLAGYAWGLLWLLLLAGIQFAAFVYFEHDHNAVENQELPDVQTLGVRDSGVSAGRVRGGVRAGHPDRATHHHADLHRHRLGHTRLERHANGFPYATSRDSYRRPDPDLAVRPDSHTG